MPEQIQVIGGELAIKWRGGAESFVPLERLRRACPCATCGGEVDLLGRSVRPLVEYNARSFALRDFQIVGGYAFQPTWGDGHSTGLYPFAYLQRLGEGSPLAEDAPHE